MYSRVKNRYSDNDGRKRDWAVQGRCPLVACVAVLVEVVAGALKYEFFESQSLLLTVKQLLVRCLFGVGKVFATLEEHSCAW